MKIIILNLIFFNICLSSEIIPSYVNIGGMAPTTTSNFLCSPYVANFAAM